VAASHPARFVAVGETAFHQLTTSFQCRRSGNSMG
jgi:hypothetical protein